jgi:YihY family inner membrane protein
VNHSAGTSAHTGPTTSAEGKPNAITQAIARLDGYQRRHPWLAFPVGVVKKFGDDQAGYLAALVAYYAFFSLFPLLLVFVTVLGFVLGGNDALRQKVLDTVVVQIPVIGDQIKDVTHPIHGSGLALAVGIAGTLLAGLAVIQALQHGMDEIWDVPRTERPNFLWSRLRAVFLLAVLGVGSLASTLLSGVAASGASLGYLGGAFKAGSIVASLALNFALFLVSFRVLTAAKISWRNVVPGAAAAALGWAALQSAGTYYVSHQLRNASATYGLFAVVIGLLSWIYLGAQLTFVAAEVNVVRTRRLWPRGLQPPLTEADRRALAEEARQQELRPEQKIRVEFEPAPATAKRAST